MRRLLSHVMRKDAPGWPGNPTVEIRPVSVIDRRGASCNSSVVEVFNHFGTHFDAPRHYNPDGPAISQLPFDRFFYERPLLLDIPKDATEPITAAELMPYENQLRQCDLLMLRTGFEQYRTSDPQRYSAKGPWLGSDAAKYLMENHFYENIKTVAGDFLSFATPDFLPDGHETHNYLLGNHGDGYICIIEDLSMRYLPSGFLKSAVSMPYFIEGIDSAPVTVWVEY